MRQWLNAEGAQTSDPAPSGGSIAVKDSLRVARLLAVVGGFLNAFTYFGHGRVFANAMTGNIVLLGAFAAAAFASASPIRVSLP